MSFLNRMAGLRVRSSDILGRGGQLGVEPQLLCVERVPPYGIPGMSNLEDISGQTQEKLGGQHILAGLGTPRDTPGPILGYHFFGQHSDMRSIMTCNIDPKSVSKPDITFTYNVPLSTGPPGQLRSVF